MAADQGWVALLQKRLEAENLPYQVVNTSVSGDTSANARTRLGSHLDQYQPEIVLLEIGGNDGLRGLSLAELKRNLAAIIQTLQDRNIAVLLIGVRPVRAAVRCCGSPLRG